MSAALYRYVSTLLEILQRERLAKVAEALDTLAFQPFLRFYVLVLKRLDIEDPLKFQPFLRFYRSPC
jgi:hypothetical protein